MNIGNKLQSIRIEHGMTQAEFADKFNVSRQTVSNWENNKNYPELDTLCKISEEYGISLDTFLKDDQEYISHIDKATIQATRSIKWLRLLIPAVILLLIAAIAFALHQDIIDPTEVAKLPGIDDKEYEYPVNEYGQTYGLDWAGDDYEKHAPDLIKAEGVNGKTGYVKRSDLDDYEWAEVKNPEDAVAYMNKKNQRQGKNYYRIIPVFEKDGITEIDQFWIYDGAGDNSAGPNTDIDANCRKVTVPDLLGLTREEAEEKLSNVGLTVGNVYYKTNNSKKGKIASQNPTAGSVVVKGNSVDISIDN